MDHIPKSARIRCIRLSAVCPLCIRSVSYPLYPIRCIHGVSAVIRGVSYPLYPIRCILSAVSRVYPLCIRCVSAVYPLCIRCVSYPLYPIRCIHGVSVGHWARSTKYRSFTLAPILFENPIATTRVICPRLRPLGSQFTNLVFYPNPKTLWEIENYQTNICNQPWHSVHQL
jgi:hypothetical protein